MTQQDNGGPAFPLPHGEAVGRTWAGMTLRQYAAINLRVPDSGTDWLDAMILEAKRDDIAGQAMIALPHIGGGSDLDMYELAHDAYAYADAMIAARKVQP